MYPFEVMSQDGRRHPHFERWDEHKRRLFESYPVPQGKTRIELELYHPRNCLEHIPFAWNPHADMSGPGGAVLPAWFPFYSDPGWSTVFDVYEMEYPLGRYLRMFVEDGHENPWGEPIRLMSTSSEFEHDHANRMAYFRGQYWSVVGPMFHYGPRAPLSVEATIHQVFDRMFDEVVEERARARNALYNAIYNAMDFTEDEEMTITPSARYRARKERKYKLDWSKDGF